MPICRNAGAPEFCGYRFEVCGVPFYVGVGRAARAGVSGRVAMRLPMHRAAPIFARFEIKSPNDMTKTGRLLESAVVPEARIPVGAR